MSTPTARDQYVDMGEALDIIQVLGPGGAVLTGQTLNGLFYGTRMATDNVTAHAGGGQALGVPVTTPLFRVTTVGTAADSITLPPAIRGNEITIINDAAANAMNVFPAVGETINGAAANTALSILAQNGTGTAGTILFYCFSNGAWRTK